MNPCSAKQDSRLEGNNEKYDEKIEKLFLQRYQKEVTAYRKAVAEVRLSNFQYDGKWYQYGGRGRSRAVKFWSCNKDLSKEWSSFSASFIELLHPHWPKINDLVVQCRDILDLTVEGAADRIIEIKAFEKEKQHCLSLVCADLAPLEQQAEGVVASGPTSSLERQRDQRFDDFMHTVQCGNATAQCFFNQFVEAVAAELKRNAEDQRSTITVSGISLCN